MSKILSCSFFLRLTEYYIPLFVANLADALVQFLYLLYSCTLQDVRLTHLVTENNTKGGERQRKKGKKNIPSLRLHSG